MRTSCRIEIRWPYSPQWMKDYCIEPALRLGERQEQAVAGRPKKAGRDCYELLDEAIDDLSDKYGRKSSAPKR